MHGFSDSPSVLVVGVPVVVVAELVVALGLVPDSEVVPDAELSSALAPVEVAIALVVKASAQKRQT